MEGLIAFAKDHMIIIIAAIIAILLVVSLVKTVVKWIIIAIVIIGILVYGFNYDVGTLKDVGQKVMDTTKEEALQLLIGDTENAQYEQSQDGSFSVFGKNIRLDGKIGSNDAKLIVAGQSFNIKIDQAVQAFIDEVKSN